MFCSSLHLQFCVPLNNRVMWSAIVGGFTYLWLTEARRFGFSTRESDSTQSCCNQLFEF